MKHKINITQTLRHLLQVAACVFFSGLFLSIFTALKDVVVSLITGTFSITGLAGQLILLAIAVLFTILWGRFFCGYLCAFGSVQELIGWVFGHLFPRSRKVHPQFDRVMKYFKYAVLLAIVVLVWILQLPVDSSLSPWGVFGMLISGNLSVMSAAVPTLGFALLMAILIGSVFVERFFCRYLCPLGALFTLISGQRFFKIRRKESVCSGCRLCSRNCAMGVSVHDRPVVESGECIECMRCIGVCAPEALTANLNPAVAGTAAALMMCGLISVGNLTVDNTTVYAGEEQALSSIIELADKDTLAVETTEEKAGPFTDGVYTGRGDGFRGDVQVQVTVENGLISDITVLSAQDDAQYFNRAVSGIVAAILEQQSPNVDVVSGATFSSRGIMEAVADALSVDFDSSAVETAETSSDSAAIAVDEVPAASAEPVAETEEEAQYFLSKVKDHELYELFYLTLFFGLRREEILGLRWSAIDLNNKTMSINHTVTKGTIVNRTNTTKTASSAREYPLTDEQVEMFSQLKDKEKTNRKLFGNSYFDNDYVFKHADGSLYYPDYPTKAFRKIIKKIQELPQGITFHGLRSSCVSILVRQNMDVKSIQKWVGHTDIDTTLRIYAKVKDKEAKREISDAMNGIIPLKDYNRIT